MDDQSIRHHGVETVSFLRPSRIVSVAKTFRGEIGAKNPYTWGSFFTTFILVFPGIAANMGSLASILILFIGFVVYYLFHEVLWASFRLKNYDVDSLRSLITSYGGLMSTILAHFYDIFVVSTNIFSLWFSYNVLLRTVRIVFGKSGDTMILLMIGFLFSVVGAFFPTPRKLKGFAVFHVGNSIFCILILVVILSGYDWSQGWQLWSLGPLDSGIPLLLWPAGGTLELVQMWSGELRGDSRAYEASVFWNRFSVVAACATPILVVILLRGPAAFSGARRPVEIGPFPFLLSVDTPLENVLLWAYTIHIILSIPFIPVASYDIISRGFYSAEAPRTSTLKSVLFYATRVTFSFLPVVLTLILPSLSIVISLLSIFYVLFIMFFIPLTLWWWNGFQRKSVLGESEGFATSTPSWKRNTLYATGCTLILATGVWFFVILFTEPTDI